MRGMSAIHSVNLRKCDSAHILIIYLREDCSSRIGEVVRMVATLTGFLKEGNHDNVTADFSGDFNGVHISPMPGSNIVTVILNRTKETYLFLTMLTTLGCHYRWEVTE